MGEREKIEKRRDVRVAIVALISNYRAGPRLEPAGDSNGLAIARWRRDPDDAAVGIAFQQGK
jgi:hypothetical protein